MKLKNNKKKLRFLSIGLFGILPLVLASCSTVTSKTELLNKTISVADGDKLDSNISLQNYANTALNSDDGMKAYVNNIANALILDWFKRASTNSNSFEYRVLYNNQVESVNDAWDTTVENYNKADSSTADIKIQQNEFDPNGGTEDSYKEKKMLDWAVSQFKDYLFKTSYLTYNDTNGKPVKNPTSASVNDLYDALSRQAFVFANPDTTSTQEESTTLNINTEYANFMNFVWQQYVEIENPFVVDMSLWKYGTPIQGISDLYLGLSDSTSSGDGDSNGDSGDSSGGSSSSTASAISSITREGDSDSGSGDSGSGDSGNGDSSTVLTSGSYTHPFFGNDSSNPQTGTITKFFNFVTNAKNTQASTVKQDAAQTGVTIPFKSEFDTKNYGLLNIPKDYTDDSSTFILAKNGSIYSDLYPEFAAASSYLFWRNERSATGAGVDASDVAANSADKSVIFANGEAKAGIPSIDRFIQQSVNIESIQNDATTGLDQITKLFVSEKPFFTTNGSFGLESSSQSNHYPEGQLKLSSDYVSKVINPKGSLKAIANQDLYTIDAFVGDDKSNLNNFMFLRNQAGVHAISIDGAYYINANETGNTETASTFVTASTTANSTNNTASVKKQRAGQVVLFRSMLNNITNKPQNYDFAVDIQSELKTFFENNLSWLVLSYAQQQDSTQKLFVLDDVIKKDSKEYNAAVAINNFLHETSLYNKVYDYNNTLVKQKSTYSANYGTDATKNGLAAPWVFGSFAVNTAKAPSAAASPENYTADRYRLNPYLSFHVAATVDVVNNPFAEDKKEEAAEQKNPDGSTFVSKTQVKSAIDELTKDLKSLSSDYSGFKYRQQIYTDSKFVNYALIGFSSSSDNLKNISEIAYLKNYVNDVFDSDKLEFKSSAFSSTGISYTLLNEALNNYFFNSTFDAATYKWDRLSTEDNKTWNTFVNTTQVDAGDGTNQTTKVTKLINDYKKQLWSMSVEVLSSAAISSYLSLYTAVASIKYLAQNDFSNFFTYLKSQYKVGTDVYVAWENSQNTLLQADKKTNGQDLLKVSNKNLNRNINNSFYSDYIGGYYLDQELAPTKTEVAEPPAATTNNNPTTTTNNTDKYSVYSDANASYYNIVGNMVGFKGIQTSATNSLNTLISKRLFTEPKTDNNNSTGLLYSYIDQAGLKKLIESTTTLSGINSIASSLGDKLNQSDIKEIGNDKEKTLSEKKEELLKVVDKLKTDNSSGGVSVGDIFKQRKGMVGEGVSNANTKDNLISENTPVQYAAYAIQLNQNDLKDINSLKTALKTPEATVGNGYATQSNTVISITDTEANEIIANLIVQQAMQTTVQGNMLTTLLSQNKINVYDVRLYSTLGPQWVVGWKETD